jgi:hypothetical protein
MNIIVRLSSSFGILTKSREPIRPVDNESREVGMCAISGGRGSSVDSFRVQLHPGKQRVRCDWAADIGAAVGLVGRTGKKDEK